MRTVWPTVVVESTTAPVTTKMTEPTPLPIAVRVYPKPHSEKARGKRRGLKHWRRPRWMLCWDVECRTDAAQALTFGSYRFFDRGLCLEEGLFFADDLPVADRAMLDAYVKTHLADTDRRQGVPELQLLSRDAFLVKFHTAAYKARSLVCNFNQPFDCSRLAFKYSNARDRFTSGFSLALWDYLDNNGDRQEDKYRPRIAIKHIDSKRALKGFTGRLEPDTVDQIPEGSTTGEPDPAHGFRGHFLDLRTLAFVLTDRGHSL